MKNFEETEIAVFNDQKEATKWLAAKARDGWSYREHALAMVPLAGPLGQSAVTFAISVAITRIRLGINPADPTVV